MLFSKGHIPWNKGRKNVYSGEMLMKRSESVKKNGTFAGENNPMFGKHHSDEAKKKMVEKRSLRVTLEETRDKLRKVRSGKGNPMYGRHRYKEENPNWRGGISSISNLVRTSERYAEWRQKCLLRDDFTCQECGVRGGDLHVHHSKSFAMLLKEAIGYLSLFPTYDAAMGYLPLWDLDNGVTLCEQCHRQKQAVNA